MRVTAAVAAALLLLVAASFAPTLDNGFVMYDDDFYLQANPALHAAFSVRTVRWAFTTFTAANWHPLTWLSHRLDFALFGLRPGGHHLVGAVFHAANALALFALLRACTGALFRSALAAALFAVHPLHVESVAWASERKDVLSTFLLLLTLLAYRRYAARPAPGRYAPVALLFAAGLLAKPMLVSAPLLLLVLDYWPLGRLGAPRTRAATARAGRLIAEKLPLVALAAVSGAMTLAAQTGGGAVKTFQQFPFALRLGNALISLVTYVQLTLWPRGLAAFYPHPGHALSFVGAIAAAALLAAATLGAVGLRRHRPALLAGWGWFLVLLSPVLGLVQVGEQALADRYTYVAQTGLVLAALWGALPRTLPGRGRAAAAAAATAVLLPLAAAARLQVGVWHDTVTLFEHAISVTRDNFLAHDNLAGALVHAGRPRDALRHAVIALRIRPEPTPGRYLRLGKTLLRQRMYAEAIEVLEQAARLAPADPEARNLLQFARASSRASAGAGR